VPRRASEIGPQRFEKFFPMVDLDHRRAAESLVLVELRLTRPLSSRDLGVERRGGNIGFNDTAPLASIRRAFTTENIH
jgi:hypothetical protein